MSLFSFARWWAIVRKEFLQLRRDRVTFAMIVGLPVIQLILFGFAVNLDPKRLPAAVVSADSSEFTRSFIASMETSDYFRFIGTLSPGEARTALERGDVLFILHIPPDFSRRLVRGESPALLLEADAADPSAAVRPSQAVQALAERAARRELVGPLSASSEAEPKAPAFTVRVHNLYNPEGLTHYNVIPGLIGVVMSMTLVMMTGLAMTRERERGTMENLLATPALPLEVTGGKIVPYIFIGLIQTTVILLAAKALFRVPIAGSVVALYAAALAFIASCLTVGITLSSLARNQLQAMQLTFFYFLPGVMMSGFVFPFAGMPKWAQAIGSALPVTHFNRAARAIMLKGAGIADIWTHLWPVLLFTAIVMTFAVVTSRRTMD